MLSGCCVGFGDGPKLKACGGARYQTTMMIYVTIIEAAGTAMCAETWMTHGCQFTQDACHCFYTSSVE